MTAWALGLLLAVAGCAERPAGVVFAAASTTDVVHAVVGDDLTISVGATSTLARQIARGAPADVFVAADPAWVDWLAGEGVPILDRAVVATGRLVVVGPRSAARGSLADVLGAADRIALADPSHVPAGRYARQALDAADLWDDVRARVLQTSDVRAAPAAVETGAADRAIVYASDAAASPRTTVLHVIPALLAEPQFEVVTLQPRGVAAAERLRQATDAWAQASFERPDR